MVDQSLKFHVRLVNHLAEIKKPTPTAGLDHPILQTENCLSGLSRALILLPGQGADAMALPAGPTCRNGQLNRFKPVWAFR